MLKLFYCDVDGTMQELPFDQLNRAIDFANALMLQDETTSEVYEGNVLVYDTNEQF